MKLRISLFLPIMLFTFMIIFLGIYIILEIQSINFIENEIEEAIEISLSALDFNVENFHTQLEMWEYAFEPNQERLDAFYSHRETLYILLETWQNLVIEESETTKTAVFSGIFDKGLEDMNQVVSNMALVNDDWDILLELIDETKSSHESESSLEEHDLIELHLLEKVSDNEKLFDELQFNKKIDEFVSNQRIQIHFLEKIITDKISNLIITVIILIPVMIIIGFIFNFVISKQIISPIHRLELASKKISEGELDVNLTPNGNYEIVNLTNSFNKMTEDLKKIRSLEKKLLVAEQSKVKDERLKSIGELSSRLSHDLRNPLSIIRMTLENLKEVYGSDAEKEKYFEKIDRSIDRIVHQVEDVLSFVKGEPLELKVIKFAEIISESKDSLVIPDRIEVILPKNDVEIPCDKKQFSIVINNLILNGIQAILDMGTVEITIEEKSDWVEIQVKDSGIGISKEKLDYVFDLLYTTKQSGTGLGLASVKSIIELHGGSVTVTSPPTIFTITLPKVSD